MGTRTREVLRRFFKRGAYPTEGNFGDLIDSFVHKSEDSLPISQVEGLAGQLNAKYNKASGESLGRQHSAHVKAFERYKRSRELEDSERDREIEAAAETADAAKKKVAEILGKLLEAGHLIQFVEKGSPDPERLLFSMSSMNLYDGDEHAYTDYVLADAATAERAGAMTAQHVKDLAALKNDAFEVILFDHIEQSNIAANTSKAPLSASADGCKVVYCRARERFLFGVPAEADSTELTYYKDWEGSERYGTVDSKGVKPAEGKLFIDLAEANGNLLDIYIFREGALRHTGGSLYNYINNTAQSLSALENTKGKANGLAPLDADGHVPEENIAPRFENVLTFNSVIEGDLEVRMQSSDLKPGDEGVDLIYSDKADRFLLRVRKSGTGKVSYYNNFKGSERYGTGGADGITPYEGKIYIELQNGRAYVWYDLMLHHIDHYALEQIETLRQRVEALEGLVASLTGSAG